MKIVLATVCMALALAACKKPDAGPIVDPALSTLVPAGTTMLAGVRVEELIKTPIYRKYLADQKLAPVDEFAKEFGIDPRKDLWEILFISNGKTSAVLGRGRFSNEAEPRLARELQGAKRTSYHGYSLVGDENSAVLLMGPTLMGVGNTAMLKSIVDARDKTNGPPAALSRVMEDVPRGSATWVAISGMQVPLPSNPTGNTKNITNVLQAVHAGSFYLDLRTGVSGKAVGIADSEAQAKELYEGLRAVMGLARVMTAKGDVRMERLYDGLRVTQEGSKVNFYIEQQEDVVVTLMDLFQDLTQGQGPEGPTPLE